MCLFSLIFPSLNQNGASRLSAEILHLQTKALQRRFHYSFKSTAMTMMHNEADMYGKAWDGFYYYLEKPNVAKGIGQVYKVEFYYGVKSVDGSSSFLGSSSLITAVVRVNGWNSVFSLTGLLVPSAILKPMNRAKNIVI